jgi:phosphatidylcholine synthase
MSSSTSTASSSRRNRLRVAAAWLVHLLTASGVVIAFLALVAIEAGEFRLALLWLLAALAIDGVDGTLARLARVKEVVPRIDGEAFDLIVDYLNYVFVPALFICRAGLVPENLEVPLAAAILLSSVYVFVRRDMKTKDNYFRGFPALWNVVALYLFAAQPGALAGAIVVLLFALLSFAPIRFVHPFRVRDYQPWLQLLAVAWAAATLALLWPGWSPAAARLWLAASLALAAMLLALGLLRSLRGPHAAAASAADG